MRPTPLAIHPAYQNKRHAIAFLKNRTFVSAYAGSMAYEYRTRGWPILNSFTGYYTPEQMNNEDGFWVIPRTV
jgi:hypothetical protein